MYIEGVSTATPDTQEEGHTGYTGGRKVTL